MKAKKSMRAWLARDKDRKLYLFKHKPVKNLERGVFFPSTGDTTFINITYFMGADHLDSLFPGIKWEDEEPTKVVIKIV